ncbi:hypothetical protein [Mesobaculum littorinae]|uniref:hypothetical protein n=1 Tax=Mesobaculum littorinae TaxID=2486419 RepID=UPI0013E4072F|nr:hypothetical protein [Mesobaculum littorinae]
MTDPRDILSELTLCLMQFRRGGCWAVAESLDLIARELMCDIDAADDGALASAIARL